MNGIEAVEGLPKLPITPLASVSCASPKVIVELDDEDELRFRITFEPYQAMRMTTADCFSLPDDISIIPQTVMEVLDSRWIHELREVLTITDQDAGFIEKSRHFLLPLQDNFLEIVAWDFRVELNLHRSEKN
jgi:hypothetical protein